MKRVAFAVALLVGIVNSANGLAGFVREGAGPVNQSMGGATVGLPLEPAGTIYWNPAGITELGSQTAVNFDVLSPDIEISSSVAAGAVTTGVPATSQSGRTKSTTGKVPFPSFGMVYHTPSNRYTFGVGAYVMGGGVDYTADPSNPILSPQFPIGVGVGRLTTNVTLVQAMPTIAMKVTDRLSIGVSPTVNWMSFTLNPYGLGAPDDADGDGTKRYPVGASSDYKWGLGIQAGLLYKIDDWNVGASIKSTQWLDEFTIHASDEVGSVQRFRYDLDYPMILSVGAGYTGLRRTRLALDIRYIDFDKTRGVGGTPTYKPDGAVTSPGWNSIFLIAAGGQYELTDAITLRAGYTFNENPIKDQDAFFNIPAPAVLRHHIHAGGTYRVYDNLEVSAAYSHSFRNSVTGPYVLSTGPVAGTSITNEFQAGLFSAGVTVRH